MIVNNLDIGGSRFDSQALINATEDATLAGGNNRKCFLSAVCVAQRLLVHELDR